MKRVKFGARELFCAEVSVSWTTAYHYFYTLTSKIFFKGMMLDEKGFLVSTLWFDIHQILSVVMRSFC